ncbi:MAG TPA: protein kinase, partial [Gemmatimonadaceae bacterium]
MSSLTERLQNALGDSYTVVRELGGGGMSRVFVAEELELGRKVVVKVLPPEMAAGVNADRFRREIQLAASLQHPHIVPLLRAGRADDLVWYTMPLVTGESLRAKLAREGELPVPDVVRIMRDVVSALAYAHANGVVHRDIKPDNILLSQGFAVVTDFGVAKAVSEATGESSLTSLGMALGTPAYMAPEQASADPHTDHRADIYALGVLGYEMLSGSPPFAASSPQMVLAAHVTQAPAAITQHRAAVPGALAAMVMRCLEKKPADRWQSASELYQQLDAMATPSGGMAPTAAVPSAATSAQPARRPRNVRLLLAAAAVIVVAGAAAFVVPRIGRNDSTGAASARPMLVVLPFQNLGGADDQYFADGMTEEITSRLAALGGLGVISRTSAMQYRNTDKPLRQIGEELNVGYVLEGTIRWEKRADGSSRVRVSPQLIKVSDDTHLWAQTYDAELKEVFTVQSDIAGQVAQALNLTLLATAATETPPTANIEAYQYYLRGNEYRNRGLAEPDIRAAVDQYERAVALDPGFAVAHAHLSSVHSQLFWFYYDRTEQRLEEARRAVARAFALDPNLPEAHIAQGLIHYWGSRDYTRALASFDLARKDRPNNVNLLAATAYVL